MLLETIDRSQASLPLAQQTSCLRIGEVVLALRGHFDDVSLDQKLEAFRVESCQVDIEVAVAWADRLSASTSATIFDSGALWTLSRRDGDFVFDFVSPKIGTFPYKRLLVDQAFRRAHILLNRELLHNYAPIYPLEYPADELLVTNYLSSGLGVEVHGCGLIDRETGGHLFLGHSGAGKSTTTQLWKSLRDPEILSDDRLILRLLNGELWMYGTPWHGEAGFASAAKAKITRIFLLQHGAHNQIREMTCSQGVGELFARSFPPFHDAAALDRMLNFLRKVAETVPCFEFSFIPDSSAVNEVLEFCD
jgi:hypothetical protein